MRVYPADAPRPSQPDSVEVSNGTDFNQIGGMLRVKDRNFPVPGKLFVVELDMTIFETPVPAQHMWDAMIGTNYRTVWQGGITQTVK